MTETSGVNLSDVGAADDLRKSLLRITDEDDLDRLPYGTVIISMVRDAPGIYTLMKIDNGDWRVPVIYGNPHSLYHIEEEDGPLTPTLPALLVLCGEELPEEPTVKPQFVLIQGGAGDEEKPDSQ